MTTWTSAENDGGLFRARGVGLSRPAARERSGRATDAGRMAPPRWVCGCSPLRGLRHRARSISAGDPSNGAEDSFTAQRSQSRSYVLASLRALHLDSDLPRQNHWHLSGWTGQSRGRAPGCCQVRPDSVPARSVRRLTTMPDHNEPGKQPTEADRDKAGHQPSDGKRQRERTLQAEDHPWHLQMRAERLRVG